MFRRKGEEEDSLFGTATITAPNPSHAAESVSVITAPAAGNSGSGNASSSSSGTTGSGSSSSSATGGGQAAIGRSLSETRPAAPTTAFRPAASPIGDMGRNRMPEAKNTLSGSAIDKTKGRRVLTVGNDILLKGEIATCDRLVIEGKVDATLNEVHTVEIAETGSFKGSAQIEDAEISGLFEGELVVRNRLVIYATGKVRGKISYGEIEIERGGELSGEIKMAGSQAGAIRPARPASAKEDKFAA